MVMQKVEPMVARSVPIGRRGSWTFTRETLIQGDRAQDFFDLYNLAFTPLRTRSAARQVLTASEFFDQLDDPRIDKYVAWDDGGEPVGLTTLTTHLDTVPWISPEYFAAHYPEHWARRSVYYLGFVVTHPRLRHEQFLETIVRVGIERLATEHAVLAYDVCAYNNTVLRFGERVMNLLAGHQGIELAALDTQTYYAVRFG